MDSRLCLLAACATAMMLSQALMFVMMKRRMDISRRDFWMQVYHTRRLTIRENCKRLLLLLPRPRPKKLWKCVRSSKWWDEVVPTFDDKKWIASFRVKKCTFDWICARLDVALAPHPKQVIKNHALSTAKIVGIAIYKLAHVAEYETVGNLFGVYKSTVHNCVYAFCYAVTELLTDEFIMMPSEAEAEDIAKHFEEVTHIPQLIGAIDGSHIPITGPRDGHSDFVNRKLYCSFVLQAVVDHQYLFRDISCKLPGSCHDADALRESSLFKNIDNVMPKGTKVVDGFEIPFMLMGDPAYPLQPWLIKNYTYHANISPEMDSFNVHLNKGRVVVENAFGRLKGRWRVLLRQSEINYTFIPTMVAACCTLHNICEVNKISFDKRWLTRVEQAERDFPQPDTDPFDEVNQHDAVDARDHLMLYLANNFEVITSIRGRNAAD